MAGAIAVTLNFRDRLTLAAAIERLINLLDDLDGDADFEPDHGWRGVGTGCDPREGTDDREGDDEREHDPAEHGICDKDALALYEAG